MSGEILRHSPLEMYGMSMLTLTLAFHRLLSNYVLNKKVLSFLQILGTNFEYVHGLPAKAGRSTAKALSQSNLVFLALLSN